MQIGGCAMKRSISIILVVAMLVSAIAFSIPTNAAAAVNIDYVEAKYLPPLLPSTDIFPRLSGAIIP